MQDVKCIEFNRISETEISCNMSLTSPPMLGESGLALLIQIVVINLLKTPGMDFYEPDIGGGLGLMATGGTDTQQILDIEANLTMAVAAVENQIKRSQLGENYPPSERLARLGLSEENRIFPIEDPPGVIINIEIANEAGDTSITGMFVCANGGEQ